MAAVSTNASPDATSLPSLVSTKDVVKEKFERVEFKTRDKQTIHARFYKPRKKGRAPAVMVVHNAGGCAEDVDKIAINLQRKGFAVLVPNLRGHGPSVSEKCNWSTTESADDQARTWAFAVRDLEASASYLRDLKSVHNSNLSMVGVGSGALLAARYAVQDENSRAVALVAPDNQNYGFDILKDLIELGGLPVLIMCESKHRKDSVRIANASAKGNDGMDFVEVKSLKPVKGEALLEGTRLSTEVTKFLEGHAMPKR